jgi:GNAT superfamily N-acetyltransferase
MLSTHVLVIPGAATMPPEPFMLHSSPSLAEESNRLFQHAWTYFARQLPRGGTTRLPGLLLANGRSPLPFMNAALVTSPLTGEAELRGHIEHAARHFRADGVHWILVISNDLVPDSLRGRLSEICSEAGMEYMMPMYGMATDRLLEPVRPLPAIDLRLADGEELRAAIGDLNAAGYAIPAEICRPVTTVPEIWKDMIGVVGLVDGVPVATASVATIDDIAYVALVATHPEQQRKGYAEAVMRRALAQAREAWGPQRTVLHATAAGRPVYARMGYAETVGFESFSGA